MAVRKDEPVDCKFRQWITLNSLYLKKKKNNNKKNNNNKKINNIIK